MNKPGGSPPTIEKIPVYCYQCVAGPDLLKVIVKDGVAIGVEPNSDVGNEHPACGKVCVRAYGLVQKLYNPARIKTPMRRTNPKKGRHEDPRWAPCSWDAALDLLATKLRALRAAGLTDASGYPRLAVTFGLGGIAPAYLGTFAALLAAWGPVDQGIGSGPGRSPGGGMLGATMLVLALGAIVWLAYVIWSGDPAFTRATLPFREGPTAVAIVGAGYLAPFLLLALAIALAGLALPAVTLAGALMIWGQVHAKFALILTAGQVRPVTLGNLSLERRSS
jgi:hypothetical protein